LRQSPSPTPIDIGGDLAEFAAAGEGGIAPLIKDLVANLHRALVLFAEMRALLVVAVNGAAAGAGLGLALAGDHVIAAENARFKMAYTAAGVTPDGGTTYFLPRLIGLRRTQELIYSNRSLTAADALQLGMVTQIVADRDLETQAMAMCQTFARGPSGAHGAAKKLLLVTFQHSLREHLSHEEDEIAVAAVSPDEIEGVRAFVENRAPTFS
jgi:2-(1,2-epoxy-1,2-dihydrophenyl)acetyl-CoA isomerase